MDGHAIHVYNSGAVVGFHQLVEKWQFLRDRWQHCVQQDILGGYRIVGSIDEPDFRNVLLLSLHLKTLGRRDAAVGNCILAWIGAVITQGFRKNIDSLGGHREPVPIRLPGRKRANVIDPQVAWNVLTEADQKRVAPDTLLRCGEGQRFSDISESLGRVWEHMRCAMAIKKAKRVFGGVKQVSIAFDPSTYSGEETSVGIAYANRHGGVASYMPIAVIPNGKVVPPTIPCNADILEVIRARKQVRWSAYKD